MQILLCGSTSDQEFVWEVMLFVVRGVGFVEFVAGGLDSRRVDVTAE